MLFKKERNQIFNLITAYGLSHEYFEESNDTEKYILRFKKSKFFVAVETFSDGYYRTRTFPLLSTKTELSYWDTALRYVDKWLSFVRDEMQTVDLWAEAQANVKLFASSVKTPNEMFSDTELRQLQGQIRQIEQGIIALGLPAAAQQALLGTIKEAPEKATRFTKKEWQGWFIGAVVAQVTNLALSPEHVAAVAQLLKSTFMGLLQLH